MHEYSLKYYSLHILSCMPQNNKQRILLFLFIIFSCNGAFTRKHSESFQIILSRSYGFIALNLLTSTQSVLFLHSYLYNYLYTHIYSEIYVLFWEHSKTFWVIVSRSLRTLITDNLLSRQKFQSECFVNTCVTCLKKHRTTSLWLHIYFLFSLCLVASRRLPLRYGTYIFWLLSADFSLDEEHNLSRKSERGKYIPYCTRFLVS